MCKRDADCVKVNQPAIGFTGFMSGTISLNGPELKTRGYRSNAVLTYKLTLINYA